ncbi:TPA: hypothetical protein HA234_00260 [Candidatus Woesearchaeota archaeon]|nr:hypothetical protein [Candidatus Woesearchaeota archaeon]HIG92611.1 hypothetical protein [Candidatus Woesearchaeota archaeon]
MSLKKLLGMESFPLEEREIMERIQTGFRNNLDEVEFSFNRRKVKVKLSHLAPEGMMKGYQDYYAK